MAIQSANSIICKRSEFNSRSKSKKKSVYPFSDLVFIRLTLYIWQHNIALISSNWIDFQLVGTCWFLTYLRSLSCPAFTLSVPVYQKALQPELSFTVRIYCTYRLCPTTQTTEYGTRDSSHFQG